VSEKARQNENNEKSSLPFFQKMLKFGINLDGRERDKEF
jgi:hypothetical protein